MNNLILENQVWAILPTWISHALSAQERPIEVNLPIPMPHKALQPIEQSGIAVLPIGGVILPQANVLSQLFGATTLDQLTDDFQNALQNPHVSDIILAIDSPGGVVTGVHECAEMIYQARGKKPMTAYIAGLGASAAYWLASSCDEIVLDATASVGSIGVLAIHTDDKQQKAQQGLSQISIVSSQSPRKRLDITTEEGRADLQAQVDAIADVFVAAVAKHRNVSVETVLADFGQGGLFVGEQAVKQGLADRLGSLQQLIQEKIKTRSRLTRSNPTKRCSYPLIREKIMNEPVTHPTLLQNITLEDLIQCRADLVQAIELSGANKERERILAVEDKLMPGHEALIQQLKCDGKTTGSEAAEHVLAAEQAARSTQLSQLQAQSYVPLSRTVTEEGGKPNPPKKVLSLEEHCREDWETDAALQAEFLGEFETYFAYRKAEANGQIKWLVRSD